MAQEVNSNQYTVQIFRQAKSEGKWIAVHDGALTLVDKPGLWAWLRSFFGKPIARPEGTALSEIDQYMNLSANEPVAPICYRDVDTFVASMQSSALFSIDLLMAALSCLEAASCLSKAALGSPVLPL